MEFADLPLGVARFGGAGVTLGGELAGGGFDAGDAGDQLGPVRSFDFGAELEAEPAAELVAFGAEPADLLAGDGEVGAQAGLGGRGAAAGRGDRAGPGLMLALAALSGFDVLADAAGIDQPGGYLGSGGNRGRGDRCPGGFEGLHGVQGTLPLVLAGSGAGGQHGLGAAGGGHAVPVARAAAGISGRVRAARARRRIRLASSIPARWAGSIWESSRCIASVTAVNASISELLDHRNLNVTRCYYRVGEERRRDAVDKVTAMSFDRHGNRIWRDARALLESEHPRYAVGEVAVPYGRCSEPSNVRAGGGACPVRFRCAGCDHFRTDISYLPDLTAYLDDLLRTRERLAAAIDGVDDWARADATPAEEEITRIRRLIGRIKGDIAQLPDAERARTDEAVTVIRKHRAVSLGMPGIRAAPPAPASQALA